MGQWVLLRHELPDGTWHHDWMLEDPGDPDGRLLTFRLDASVAWPPRGGFEATRLGAHRREYLSYEGEISGGRGIVRRVARGRCRLESSDPGCMAVEMQTVDGGSDVVRLTGRRGKAGGDLWGFDLEKT